jgi:hypothetical protein
MLLTEETPSREQRLRHITSHHCDAQCTHAQLWGFVWQSQGREAVQVIAIFLLRYEHSG